MRPPILPAAPTLVPGSVDADVDPARIADPEARAVVLAVRADPTVLRPFRVKRVGAPLARFTALVDDLPGTARKVERIGAGRYRITALGPGVVRIEDGQGAEAVVDTVLHEAGARVYRALGSVRLPALPEIRGTGVVALRFEEEGPGAVLTGGQIHFRLESGFLHLLARPFLRLLKGVIDARAGRLVDAAVAVSEWRGADRDA